MADGFPAAGLYRKKPIPIRAVPVTESLTIQTLEGEERGGPGDMLLTGVNGEQYFTKCDWFARNYQPTGQPDMYVKKPIVVTVERLTAPREFDLPWGLIRAEAGDYVVTGPDGSRHPVNAAIFRDTYEPA